MNSKCYLILASLLSIALNFAHSVSSEDMLSWVLDNPDIMDDVEQRVDHEISYVTIGSKYYRIMSVEDLSSWNSNTQSGQAAFRIKELKSDRYLTPFSSNPLCPYRELSNLTTTPFIHNFTAAQSVESMIWTKFLERFAQKRDIARTVARLDGHSARQVGKYYKFEPSFDDVKSMIESKLVQRLEIQGLLMDLMFDRRQLFCVDKTPYDSRGLDTYWGMVRHGEYMVGENMLGKLYHEIHKEMHEIIDGDDWVNLGED